MVKKHKKKPKQHLDGIDITKLTYEQLPAFIDEVWKEIQKTRSEKEAFYIESRKLFSYWELTRRNLITSKNNVNELSAKLLDEENDHEKTLLDDRHQTRHLQYENSMGRKKSCHISAAYFLSLREGVGEEEHQIVSDINNLQQEMKDSQLQWETALRYRTIEQERLRAEMFKCHKMQSEQKEDHFEIRMEETLGELKMELGTKKKRVLDLKERDLSTTLKAHYQERKDVRDVYERIMSHNLSLIAHLTSNIKDIGLSSAFVNKMFEHNKQLNRQIKKKMKEERGKCGAMSRKLFEYDDKVHMLHDAKTRYTSDSARLEEAMLARHHVEAQYMHAKLRVTAMIKKGIRYISQVELNVVQRREIYRLVFEELFAMIEKQITFIGFTTRQRISRYQINKEDEVFENAIHMKMKTYEDAKRQNMMKKQAYIDLLYLFERRMRRADAKHIWGLQAMGLPPLTA